MSLLGAVDAYGVVTEAGAKGVRQLYRDVRAAVNGQTLIALPRRKFTDSFLGSAIHIKDSAP